MAIGMTGSDCLAQYIEQKTKTTNGNQEVVLKSNFDPQRTLRMIGVALIQAPQTHYYFKILEYFLPGKSTKIVLGKLAFDQLIYAPFGIAMFFWTCNNY